MAGRKIRSAILAGSLALLVGSLVVPRAAQNELRRLDARAPIPYFIAEGNSRSGYRPADRQLAEWAFEAWQRVGENRFRFVPASSESASLVRLYWADATGGQYGEMRPLVVDSRRGAAVYIRPDIDALGEDIAHEARSDTLLRDSIVYLTCVHELGHALGLSHTNEFADIMYFFGFGGDIVKYFGRYRDQIRVRSDIAGAAGVSQNDIRRLRLLYSTE
jgi:matrixin